MQLKNTQSEGGSQFRQLLVLYPTVPPPPTMTETGMYDSSTGRLLEIEIQGAVTEEVGISRQFNILTPDMPHTVDLTQDMLFLQLITRPWEQVRQVWQLPEQSQAPYLHVAQNTGVAEALLQ